MLVYGLSQILLNEHEGITSRFINFSHADILSIADEFEIPISRGTSTSEVFYVSAIPQLMFKDKYVRQSLTLSDVSDQVLNQLINQKSKLLNTDRNHKSCERDHKVVDNFVVSQLWDELKIETKRSGWVSFHLSVVGVNLWLKHLNTELSNLTNHFLDQPEKAPSNLSAPPLLDDPQVWQAQYTHARCCSLIRLWNAQVDGPYQVRNDTDWVARDMTANNSDRRRWEPPQSASARKSVIYALITLLDLAESDLFWIPYRWPSKQYFLLLNAVIPLCQAFEQFLAIDLSGFGNVNILSETAVKCNFQVSFTLALIVEKTLKVLLEGCLGVDAPIEL